MKSQLYDMWLGFVGCLMLALFFAGVYFAQNRQEFPVFGIGPALIAWGLAILLFMYLRKAILKIYGDPERD